MIDELWTNAKLVTLAARSEGLGLVEKGAIACKDGIILYAGPEADLPYKEALRRHDCEGRLITPGLIDCHPHLVYGGDRSREFELRLAGASYEEIAKAGAGPKWFQIYMNRDMEINRWLVQRAKAAGFSAIVLTADALGPGQSDEYIALGRPRDPALTPGNHDPRFGGRGNFGRTRAA